MKKTILFIVSSCFLIVAFTDNVTEKHQPNILFIPIDDLRPDFETYGNVAIKTPNITRIANKGVT